MANSLGRDIPKNAFVVLSAECADPAYLAYESRVGIAKDGFGLRYSSMGHAVIVSFLDGVGSGRIEGDHLSKDETLMTWDFIMSIPFDEPGMLDILIEVSGIKLATAIFDCYFALKKVGYVKEI